MEELTHDFLSFLPAALLTLAAAGAPEVYKLAARRFLGRAKSHMASWLYILLDSFLTPVAGLFRVLLALLPSSRWRLSWCAAQRPEPSGFRNKSDDGTLF